MDRARRPGRWKDDFTAVYKPATQLSQAQRDELFVQILQSKDLLHAAVQHLDADQLYSHVDYRGILLVACSQANDAGFVAGTPDFFHRVRIQTDALIQELDAMKGRRLLPEESAELTALIDIAEEARHPNVAYGYELLKRRAKEISILTPLKQLLSDGNLTPANLSELLDLAGQKLEALAAIGNSASKTFAEEWDDHEQKLALYRGRPLIGLQTGLDQFDNRTLGLRGLFLLGAPPGVGKTALCGQIGLGVARYNPDAIFVFLSLEMDRSAIYTRLKANLAELDWKVLTFGSPQETRHTDSMFSDPHEQKLTSARNNAINTGLANRLTVLDRAVVGETFTVASIHTLIERAKERAKARRALIVLDYLQLLHVPDDVADRGDLDADKYRIRFLQKLIEQSRTEQNPGGDAVLAISEARKPSKSTESWGQSLSELMGSARLAYAADGVLLYRAMDDHELKKYYGLATTYEVQNQLATLEAHGIAPIMLNLEKGRDGMTRGSWPLGFHFRQSRFVEMPEGPTVPSAVPHHPHAAAPSTVAATSADTAPTPAADILSSPFDDDEPPLVNSGVSPVAAAELPPPARSQQSRPARNRP